MDSYYEWDERKGRDIYRGVVWPEDWASRPERKSAAAKPGKVLEGMACAYGKVHRFNGRNELFQKGCFGESLNSRICFYIDHKSENCIGDTDANLELIDSDDGLVFRLALSERDLKQLDGRERMSPAYYVDDAEDQSIGGQTVRVIKKARLEEISGVRLGAVWQAYSRVREVGEIRSLRDDIKSIIAFQPEAPDPAKMMARYSRAVHEEARRKVLRVY